MSRKLKEAFRSCSLRAWGSWCASALMGVLCLGALTAFGAVQRNSLQEIDATSVGTRSLASTTSEVWVYTNTDEETNGLPRLIPVVVSFKGLTPSVAFQLGCGSSNPILLEGFGYSRDLDLETVLHFDSLKLLQDQLRELAGGGVDVPLRLLRCPPDPEVMRQQIVQVYRLIDDDPKKEPASPYLLRLRDDPGTIYTLECLNLLTALSWSRDEGRDLEQVSIPINQAVYDFWLAQGIQTREIHCDKRTARWLPPVNSQLPLHPTAGMPGDSTQLYKVADHFDDIHSPKVLYLISGDRGYALDCPAQDELKAAFGIDPSEPLEELPTSDPRYVRSKPHQQPILRCEGNHLTIFETLNEQPNVRYFRFEDDQSLVRMACPETSAFFSSAFLATRKVPVEALPYLLVDSNPTAQNEPTPILNVGCAEGLWRLSHWFREVYGHNPTAEEARRLKRLYEELKPKATQDGSSLARLVKSELSKQLVADPARFLEVIKNGVHDGKAANLARPNLDRGESFFEDLSFFLQDIRKNGAAPFETGIYQWVQERVRRSRPASRSELVATYNLVFGCDQSKKEFGKCPDPAGLSFWTGSFYDPRNQTADFSSKLILQDHEQYLKACSGKGSSCRFEIDHILARACTSLGKPCAGDQRRQNEVADWIQKGLLCPNFKSVACYVRTDRNIKSDPRQCHYPVIAGGTCP